jgi:hypothetical protein
MRIVNPQGQSRQAVAITPIAARLQTLAGGRVGVLVNEAGSALITNWDGMSHQLSRMLIDREGTVPGSREIKPMMSAPAPNDLIDRLAASDAVVNGLGK